MFNEVERFWPDTPDADSPSDSLTMVLGLLNRFHLIVRKLQERRSGRDPVKIQDEYDVQYLLYALLQLDFDDVIPEEPTPSSYGGSSRVDFLLKGENIVVEAKMARQNLRDKKIGEELLIDLNRYQAHPNCKALVCFVYDPFELVENPKGLENQFTKHHGELDVRLLVRPQGL